MNQCYNYRYYMYIFQVQITFLFQNILSTAERKTKRKQNTLTEYIVYQDTN